MKLTRRCKSLQKNVTFPVIYFCWCCQGRRDNSKGKLPLLPPLLSALDVVSLFFIVELYGILILSSSKEYVSVKRSCTFSLNFALRFHFYVLILLLWRRNKPFDVSPMFLILHMNVYIDLPDIPVQLRQLWSPITSILFFKSVVLLQDF